MKDNKLEIKDLDVKDKLNALIICLVHSEVIKEDDYIKALEEILEFKNKQLEKELKDNPAAKLIFDMMQGLK
jgi:hypothetical protein